jgi:hypothetical protein
MYFNTCTVFILFGVLTAFGCSRSNESDSRPDSFSGDSTDGVETNERDVHISTLTDSGSLTPNNRDSGSHSIADASGSDSVAYGGETGDSSRTTIYIDADVSNDWQPSENDGSDNSENNRPDGGELETDGGPKGFCCQNGKCLCRDPVPTALTSNNGPFSTAEFRISVSISLNVTVYYPTDAEPPFAAIALVDGGVSSTAGGQMGASWGPFFASWGIVVASVYSGVMALIPEPQASNLLQIIELLEMERVDMDSPLFGKMSGRYGIAGYSNGAGGCLIAAAQDPSLRTSMTLAASLIATGGAGIAAGTRVPTTMLCGSADIMAGIDQSQQIYDVVSETAPALLIEIMDATSVSWYSPAAAGGGTSGGYALAFQKVFLEGDERWKPLLLDQPDNASRWRTNIQ